MANNIVSRCLEKDAETFRWVLKGCDCKSAAHTGIIVAANDRSDYAAKLDKLVTVATAIRDDPHVMDYSCRMCVQVMEELDAALAAIKTNT